MRLDHVTSAAAPFVLVYGAWQGAWTWCRLAPLLRSAGHDMMLTHVDEVAAILEIEQRRSGARVGLAGSD